MNPSALIELDEKHLEKDELIDRILLNKTELPSFCTIEKIGNNIVLTTGQDFAGMWIGKKGCHVKLFGSLMKGRFLVKVLPSIKYGWRNKFPKDFPKDLYYKIMNRVDKTLMHFEQWTFSYVTIYNMPEQRFQGFLSIVEDTINKWHKKCRQQLLLDWEKEWNIIAKNNIRPLYMCSYSFESEINKLFGQKINIHQEAKKYQWSSKQIDRITDLFCRVFEKMPNGESPFVQWVLLPGSLMVQVNNREKFKEMVETHKIKQKYQSATSQGCWYEIFFE